MSTTVQGVDARGYLAGWLTALTGMMISDINAIPDDKWTEPFGGSTRPANMLLADTITNLTWTTAAMKGEVSSAYDSMGSLATELVDKTAAIEKLKETTAEFGTTLTAASDDMLNSITTAPWGAPAPVFILANVAVSHVWYHDGQFNYIQMLLGDEKVHWMV